MFAYMLTGQGRVGLFLSFSFYLEVLERKTVLEGCGAAGQQAVAIMLRPLLQFLLALPLFRKNIYHRGVGAYRVSLSAPLTFVRRRGTSCMVPSPSCSNLATLVSFISKTRIKITISIKLQKLAQVSL